jgi:predicted metal-binding membrane protein
LRTVTPIGRRFIGTSTGASTRVNGTPLEAALTRDRVVVIAALVVVAVLAWAYVLWLAGVIALPAPTGPGGMAAREMNAGSMPAMDMGEAVAPRFVAWGLLDFAFTFAMWAVMMVGMMTPSVAPMVLLYAAAGRKARASDRPIAATGWFLAGYLLVWTGFSLAASTLQGLLTALALLTPMMSTKNALFGGVVLIVVGLYQWTPLKNVCLRQCQTPIAFLATHGGFHSDPLGALRLGIAHGLYCLGCCWALMVLLFVGGIMNVLWIAGIALLVLLEKIVPTARLVPRISGALIAAAGVWMLITGL